MKSEKNDHVLVTGATGYVAGWLIKKLLDKGLNVHAAVRDIANKRKIEHLNKLAEDSIGQIQYFNTDLLKKGSYDDAMRGCSVVFHTASPFNLNYDDPQKDLIEPAVKGTQNVLESAKKFGSIKRVVLTSSVAAIYGDSADLLEVPDQTLSEEDWNTTSSLTHNPYSFSKTAAEKEAWKIYDSQDNWELVVLNPALVMGPAINPSATSQSFDIIRQIGDGTLKSGVPNIVWGVVDVRDVAEAHFKAGFLVTAKGRYIISGHTTSFLSIASALLPKYEQYPIPRKTVPKCILWLIAPYIDKNLTRTFISRNVNYPLKIDNAKSRRELGLDYRPLDDTVQEMFQQLIDTNQIISR